LRVLLRIWTVIFALGAVDFFVFPYLTVRILNSTAKSLGMHEVTALNGGQDFWLTLAVPYMILVAALAWVAQRGPRIQAQPVQFLMLERRRARSRLSPSYCSPASPIHSSPTSWSTARSS